ncbi:MAG: hypothetical protein K2P45_13100 [Eubacterium sp.]|nr:hypothetical protein [Eubacterium sp.]
MLDQILTLAMSNVQMITAVLIFSAIVLEFVHIGQTSRINKRLKRAAYWLQRYLNAVFSENADEEPEQEETDSRSGIREQKDAVQLTAAQTVKSRQEEDMRAVLAHKKQKKEEELLDTVLQEIFD